MCVRVCVCVIKMPGSDIGLCLCACLHETAVRGGFKGCNVMKQRSGDKINSDFIKTTKETPNEQFFVTSLDLNQSVCLLLI